MTSLNKRAVYISYADSYDIDKLIDIMSLSLNGLCFNPVQFKGKTVALKPNLLTGVSPYSGIVTDPVFFDAAVRLVKNAGGFPVLLESPAFMPLEKVLKKTGYYSIVEREKIPIADTRDVIEIENPEGKKFRTFSVPRVFAESDYIINLPKLKTHGLTYYTGAVKNLFGLIHGLSKSKWHIKAPTQNEFVSFLMDYYGALLRCGEGRIIHMVDGIRGLEGEGPGSSGRAKFANAVVCGMDGIAVDSVSVKIAGLENEKLKTSAEGERRGLGTGNLHDIEILGDSIDKFTSVFEPPASKSGMTRWPFSSKFIKNILVEKPVPDAGKCSLCYQCKKICPAQAIDKKSEETNVPKFDYGKCIRCYCCMEVCPEAAIGLKKSLIQKLLRY